MEFPQIVLDQCRERCGQLLTWLAGGESVAVSYAHDNAVADDKVGRVFSFLDSHRLDAGERILVQSFQPLGDRSSAVLRCEGKNAFLHVEERAAA